MKSLFKVIANALLLVVGAAAIYGGWKLIVNPDGGALNLSIDHIKHSPFRDYLVPGILLLTLNGLFSLFTLVCTAISSRGYSLLIMMQGAILTLWTAIQVIMLREIHFIDFVLVFSGQMLIVCGWVLAKINNYFSIK